MRDVRFFVAERLSHKCDVRSETSETGFRNQNPVSETKNINTSADVLMFFASEGLFLFLSLSFMDMLLHVL